MKKNRLFLVVCLIMCYFRVSGQNVSLREISQIEKTPEVSSLYRSALHLISLYENDVDSLEKALTYIDKAISVNPDILQSYKWKGEILFRIGKREEALNLLSSLCAKDDCTYDLLFLTGMLYEKDGEMAKAREYYVRALDKNTALLRTTVFDTKDFMTNITIRYFIDGKILTMEEIKSLFPDYMEDTNNEVLKTELDRFYEKFDKDSFINNLWSLHN